MSEFEAGKWSFHPVAVHIIGFQTEEDGTVLAAFELEYGGSLAYALLEFPVELLQLVLLAREALMKAVSTGMEPDQEQGIERWN